MPRCSRWSGAASKPATVALLVAVSACSDGTPTPEVLGARAATAEKAFYVFNQREIHAQTFMASWYSACEMAKDEQQPLPKTMETFVQAYVDGLQSEPGAAVRKPLQTMVRERWWKSGTGCETILQETPEWARES